MQLKNETETGFSGEIKIVPAWAWALAVVTLIAAQIFFNIVLARHSDAPPEFWRGLMGLGAGIGGGCYALLIGYINRDAKRRAMSPTLWTSVAILIPNGLGVLLYFILRQPRRSVCPQCGAAVQTEFNFCPRCNCKLSPNCPQCQRVVGASDIFCPYCGTSVGSQAVPTQDVRPEISKIV